MRRENLNYLEGDQIEPLNMRKDRVEDYAYKVAKKLNFGPGDDISVLVGQLKGRIKYFELDDLVGFNGSVYVHGQFDFDILLPLYTSQTRDRFTIAHELGHYFLHSNQGETPIIAHRQGSTRIEWEANWFAASLLMPKLEFSKEIQNGRLIEVARHFGVSIEAAQVRKNALDL